MILPINIKFNDKTPKFYGEESGKKPDEMYDGDTLLENNFSTRARIGVDKITKAFTVYPVKGMTGSINSNFYEFLTMGNVPYIIGSITLMSIFNAYKSYAHRDKLRASQLGNKMALGVLFYGLFKEFSKNFIDKPVKWFTGIDTQIPYARVIHQLQQSPQDSDLTSIEYHKIGESVDFTRWDLLYKKTGTPEHNQIFDEIAKKNGLGENLNDSDQEVKPIYKEVLIKSNLARTISSYLWAAVGVGLAFQNSWKHYFKVMNFKIWEPKVFAHSIKIFGKSALKATESFLNGKEKSKSIAGKHSGKILLGTALASTILGLANTLHITKKPSKSNIKSVMNDKKETVVC